MSQVGRYASAGLVTVAVVVGLCWPWLDGPSRNGLLVAASVTLLVQVVAFGLMVRYRAKPNGFLTVWVGGTLVRMTIVIGAGVALLRSPVLPPATTLLGLAGFFFGLLLLEPVFYGDRPGPVSHTR